MDCVDGTAHVDVIDLDASTSHTCGGGNLCI
jgi:hypothetical protein